ncbi:hypothetical protein [Pseudomonas entomophila]|nr:hypothetical protein [Pseudomonas entomophila]
MNGSSRPAEVTCKKCLRVHAARERKADEYIAQRREVKQVAP